MDSDRVAGFVRAGHAALVPGRYNWQQMEAIRETPASLFRIPQGHHDRKFAHGGKAAEVLPIQDVWK
jgi:hypothetical protein